MVSSSNGVLLAVIVLTSIFMVHAAGGNGGGGNGNGGGNNGGGNNGGGGLIGLGRRIGWPWPWGRGRDNHPPHGGSNCRRWTIPDICKADEEPTIDRDGCVSCIDLDPEIDGCTIDELMDCASSWQDLPYCGTNEWPKRSNNTCCYQCRPASTDRCTKAQVAACKAAWIGADNATALPYCSNDGNSTGAPVYDSSTCCVDCKVPLQWNMTAGDDGCTLEKFQTCTAAMPVCANGETVIFDTDACCGSCRRPTRTCDIASVVRCYAAIPSCGNNELPTWLDGDCCPSCMLQPLTANSTGCESCTDKQICIRETQTSTAGNVTFTNSCKTRADITFTLTISGKMMQVFKLLSATHVRHMVAEYIRRYCDKADNMVQCAAFQDALRDVVISTTVECGNILTNGGDRRCDGRWGATTRGSEYEWRNNSIVANPEKCAITVMISVALTDDADTGGDDGGDGGNSTTSGTRFRTQSFARFITSATTGPDSMVKAALGSDSETLDDGISGEVTKDSTSGAMAHVVLSPFIIAVTMIIAIIA